MACRVRYFRLSWLIGFVFFVNWSWRCVGTVELFVYWHASEGSGNCQSEWQSQSWTQFGEVVVVMRAVGHKPFDAFPLVTKNSPWGCVLSAVVIFRCGRPGAVCHGLTHNWPGLDPRPACRQSAVAPGFVLRRTVVSRSRTCTTNEAALSASHVMTATTLPSSRQGPGAASYAGTSKWIRFATVSNSFASIPPFRRCNIETELACRFQLMILYTWSNCCLVEWDKSWQTYTICQ